MPHNGRLPLLIAVGLLGSEEQKRELLPDMAVFKKVRCARWALVLG